MKSIDKPINIALIFDQEVLSGGGYQQGLNSAILASKINPKLANIVYFHTKRKLQNNLKSRGIESQLIDITILEKFYLFLKTTEKFRIIYKFIKIFIDYNFFESYLIKKDIDLVYFISPSRFILDLNKLNFVFTLWDLCHRDHFEFPEVKLKGEFENRELRINYAAKRALSIIVDSEYGKINLSRKYNVEESRIAVIPFEPLIDIKEKEEISFSNKNLLHQHNIKNQYIFYPAQFWPHKNHIYILKAIFILEKKYKLKLNMVFSGGDKGNKSKIIAYAKNLGVQDRLIFTGFVSNKELITLYKNSLALVMPTFFGPTNLPPLEAFRLGVPVIYSDLEGLRDQVGDAALLVNLHDPETLSDYLFDLLKDHNLRSTLIKRGYEYARKNEQYGRLEILQEIIIKFRSKYYNFN